MTGLLPVRAIGAPVARIEGPAKVTGSAPYAFEHRLERPAYAHLIQATVARGRITAMDTAAALALDGVLFVLTHQNAPGWPLIATGSFGCCSPARCGSAAR